MGYLVIVLLIAMFIKPVRQTIGIVLLGGLAFVQAFWFPILIVIIAYAVCN